MPADRFARRNSADGIFWLSVLLFSFMTVGIGFFPPVVARIEGKVEPAEWTLIAHVWSFTGWLVLLALQASLVSLRNLRVHRLFGKAMIPLAAVMVWSGIMAQVQGDRLRMDERPELLAFTIIPVSYMILFAGFVMSAWSVRYQPAAHKRLILMATGTIMSGAFTRAYGPYLYPVIPEGLIGQILIEYGGGLVIGIAGAAYDLVTYRAVHRVYRITIPIYLMVAFATLSATTSAWLPDLTRFLIAR